MPAQAVSPMLLMLIAVAITLLAVALHAVIRARHKRVLAALARDWRMHYSPRDVFDLAPRIAPRLPVPGAADVRVRDLIYVTEPAGHRYIFSAEYTAGVVRSKRRRRCVISILEPRQRGEGNEWSNLRIAPDRLPIAEQYRKLKQEL